MTRWKMLSSKTPLLSAQASDSQAGRASLRDQIKSPASLLRLPRLLREQTTKTSCWTKAPLCLWMRYTVCKVRGSKIILSSQRTHNPYLICFVQAPWRVVLDQSIWILNYFEESCLVYSKYFFNPPSLKVIFWPEKLQASLAFVSCTGGEKCFKELRLGWTSKLSYSGLIKHINDEKQKFIKSYSYLYNDADTQINCHQ